MTLIIDGHNLIPKIPGLRLSDPEDECKLTGLIQEYCRLKRSNAELFFDGAPPGINNKSNGGLVHVHYIRKGLTADQAMINFLSAKGKSSRNFILISSDRRVQIEARSLGCAILTSDQFAAELINILSGKIENKKKQETSLSPQEVNEWLELFSHKRD